MSAEAPLSHVPDGMTPPPPDKIRHHSRGGEIFNRAKNLAARYVSSEAISWADGISVAVICFDLASKGKLPPEFIGGLLYAADSFSFYTANYLFKLREHLVNEGRTGFREVTGDDRRKVIQDMLLEFGPVELYDLPVRTLTYTTVGAIAHENLDPKLAVGAYAAARGGVEVGFFTWPTIYNAAVKPLYNSVIKPRIDRLRHGPNE